MWLLARLHLSTREVLWSSESISRVFQLFSIALVRSTSQSHGIVWYYLVLSLALTRSNSQHCSEVLSRLLSSRGLLFRELPRHIFVC